MTFPTNIEISRAATRLPLREISAQMGLDDDLVEPYGRVAAKISLDAVAAVGDRPRAKYVVVSSITPTPLGEGKTTTSVGLAQGFKHIDKLAILAVRQASMGPALGIKGGAAGGGYSQVVPMEALNLHLTGDIHAVGAAHNQLAAMLDNHIFKGNALDIDPKSITWRRVVDVNDRALRHIVTGLGGKKDGTPREAGFDITAASEVMAVLALATSLRDLRERLGRIVVGYNRAGEPVTAEQLKAAGAMCVILKEALKPNLMQTVEQTPALVHCGPFGNIAHGNSSIVADQIGIHCGDYLITEAGFGADMGAERFFNIKCRASGLVPDAAVIVVTVRALKAHSDRFKVVAGKPLPEDMLVESADDVRAGASNLRKQIENIRRHGVEPVVAVNAFPTDFASEHQAIIDVANEYSIRSAVSTHVVDGGAGAVDLARAVAATCDEPSDYKPLYPEAMPLTEKIETVAREVYGADGVDFSAAAAASLAEYERIGFGNLPVCIAKTHLSLSDDPKKKGAPTNWRLQIREARASVGAGFIYLIAGTMQTMPGLSSAPAAESIDIDADGEIVGLY